MRSYDEISAGAEDRPPFSNGTMGYGWMGHYLVGAALQEDVGIAVEWAIRVDEPHPRRTETAGTVMTHFNQEQARYCREVWQGWTPVRRTVGPWQEVTL